MYKSDNQAKKLHEKLLHDQWFKLPLKLRQRWWRETDYHRLEPSPELLSIVIEALTEKKHD
jgi:hypothetical protein